MENEGLKAFVGRHVKVVLKEPGDLNVKTIFGEVKDIDNGFVLLKSKQGLGSIRLEHVIAIKPAERGGR